MQRRNSYSLRFELYLERANTVFSHAIRLICRYAAFAAPDTVPLQLGEFGEFPRQESWGLSLSVASMA